MYLIVVLHVASRPHTALQLYLIYVGYSSTKVQSTAQRGLAMMAAAALARAAQWAHSQPSTALIRNPRPLPAPQVASHARVGRCGQHEGRGAGEVGVEVTSRAPAQRGQ